MTSSFHCGRPRVARGPVSGSGATVRAGTEASLNPRSLRSWLLNSAPPRGGRPVPAVLEPLEDRVLFALAAAAGGSGYSGTLSTNTSIRKQQLVCDPAEPKQGSTSTLYDPSMVTLTGVMPGPGYNNLGFIGHVEVRLRSGNTLLQPLVAFFQNPLGTETGYVQMQYRLSGSAGQITPPAGY